MNCDACGSSHDRAPKAFRQGLNSPKMESNFYVQLAAG